MGTLPVIAIIVLVVIAAVFGIQQARKRREALAAWAGQQGLDFATDKIGGFDARYPSFDCLRMGSDCYAYNISRGLWHQRPVQAFDYHYETHSTDSKGHRTTHHHHFSAVIVESKVPLKPLLIRPEGFFDRVKGLFGFEDINFESAEFSRRFYVAAPERKWAYDVLHQRAMEFLLVSPVFSLMFDARSVIAWRNTTFKPEEFTQALTLVRGLLDQLPDYVVKEQAQKGVVS